MLILSLSPIFMPEYSKNGWNLTLFYIAFCLGIILIGDYVAVAYGKVSPLVVIFQSKRSFFKFYLVSFTGGLILEFFMNYLGGFWWYPFYNTGFYWLTVILLCGFGVYFLTIISSYAVVYAVLDQKRKMYEKRKQADFGRSGYQFLLIVGVLCLGYVMWKVIQGTDFFGNFVFVINAPKIAYIAFSTVIVAFVGFSCIFEYIAYKRQRLTIIGSLWQGNWRPVAAILISALFLLLYMELQNQPIKLWQYSNAPMGNAMVFDLPLWIYIGWPLHYIGFISLYQAFGDATALKLIDNP